MKQDIFVNNGFTASIEQFLKYRKNPESVEFNSFLVVITRLLMQIYDELDILTPYNLKSELALYDNLTKFGYSLEESKVFLDSINHFYEAENKTDFISIQKMLIDMFGKKKQAVEISDNDIINFKKLLYCKDNQNFSQIAYIFKIGIIDNEIGDYFENVIHSHQKAEKPIKEKETLNLEAYLALDYSIDEIMKMDADELEVINNKIYEHFDINKNAINKGYLLDKAINDLNASKMVYSTGNGFVDMLFIMGIIATLIMVILIITFIVL